jgi:regulator of nucleoside diphosphate kinase
MSITSQNEKVPITISSHDYEQLERISMAGMRTRRNLEIAELLADELERASVVPPQDVGAKVVKMYSDLTFRDDTTNKFRRVTLVYPGEEDITFGRISILTPVGTALIGVSEGQTIGWRTASGEPRRLTVMKIHGQAKPPRR